MDRLRFKIARQAEAEAIRYVAELLGKNTDTERAIRWLIELSWCCAVIRSRSPNSRAFGTAINRRLKPHLVCSSLDS
jgi:hypothetical protein